MRDPLISTPSATGRHRVALKQLSSNLWYLVQVAALAAIVLSSFWGDDHHGTDAAASLLQRGGFVSAVRSERPSSITSRVVSLPGPSNAASALRLDVETRQMRFERGWATSANAEIGRLPASATEWVLDVIERKVGSSWENVPLVRNEDHEAVGSAFVELDSGVNEFRVTYRDSHGRKTTHPVRIRHIKTSKS